MFFSSICLDLVAMIILYAILMGNGDWDIHSKNYKRIEILKWRVQLTKNDLANIIL